MKKRLLAIGTLIAVCILFQVYRVMDSGGMLVTIVPQALPGCATLTGVTGAEDITIDQSTGYAYISSDDRRARMAGKTISGALYGLDLGTPGAQPEVLWQGKNDDFHPHGISLFHGDAGEPSLFVINHLPDGTHQVEIFAIPQQGTLVHKERIKYEDLSSPNDLVAVGPRQFYATNDHGQPHGWRRTLEDYLGIPMSNISYFDGTEGRIAASGFRYANGITVSDNGEDLYVAETTGRRVTVLKRDIKSGNLRRLSSIDVNTGADNLEWDTDGNLLLAGHPRLFDFLKHAADSQALSATQILQLRPGSEGEVRELYMNDGSEISGGSVGAAFQDTLLIGSVFEDKILVCGRP